MTHLPEVLSLHCARPSLSASDPDVIPPMEFWTKVGDNGVPSGVGATEGESGHWIPFVIQVQHQEGTGVGPKSAKVRVHEYATEKGLSHTPNSEAYQLSAVISSVRDARDGSEHLVSHVLVAPEYAARSVPPRPSLSPNLNLISALIQP